MVEVIVARDAEGMGVKFLNAELTERSIAGKAVKTVPSPMTFPLVRVSRVGGDARDVAYDSPILLFECWANDMKTAIEFASSVRGLVHAWARLSDEVTAVRGAGDLVFLPDPDTNKPRYQFAVQVDMKMSAI